MECFEERIAPALFDCGDAATGGWTPQSNDRTVVVVAHSNTIRSLMAYFDEVGEEEIPHLHVPNSVPIQYRFERQSQKILSTKLQSAAGGSHARWLLSPENHASIRKAILPGGLLTRAVIDSWDLDRTGVLSIGEIEAGIKAMLSPNVERGQSASCAVIAVAKKIVRPPSAPPGPAPTPRPAPTTARHQRDTSATPARHPRRPPPRRVSPPVAPAAGARAPRRCLDDCGRPRAFGGRRSCRHRQRGRPAERRRPDGERPHLRREGRRLLRGAAALVLIR